ncbi:hypothetical protein KC19_6G197100 [Ceratodon purpureus]|uniref:Uncharacterized protein n=1 Tax=Ceratodon purpureus TaxID=3225 RepID=A0A8T0HJF3_CERPU|nr:hypothetical protein KC19_6G197100 [Ceratodon purpureus]
MTPHANSETPLEACMERSFNEMPLATLSISTGIGAHETTEFLHNNIEINSVKFTQLCDAVTTLQHDCKSIPN